MITIKPNFLTQKECDELINLSKSETKIAKTLGKQIDGYRTAESCWINQQTLLTNKIKQMIGYYTNTPIENQEAVHIVKYKKNGEYKTHHDFFHPNTDYYEETTKRGGNRTHSCLIYLNDNFTGGETEFPKLNTKIHPEMGKLIIWTNMNSDGSLNYDSLHAGLPVIEGEKWILIVWIREREFAKQNKQG
jgi:prolyl 4-hydroxylase